MKVKVTSSHVLGPGLIANEGDILDLPENEARVKISGGYAVVHEEPAAPPPDAPGPTMDPTPRQEEEAAGSEEAEAEGEADAGDDVHPEVGQDEVVDREPSVHHREPRRGRGR